MTEGDDNPSTTAQCPVPQKPLSPEQNELSDIMARLRETQALDGIFHLGKDGVLRSLTAKRDVIDAEGLRPALLKAFLDRYPLPFSQEIEDKWRGVDGTKTPRDKWFNPNKADLPPLPTEEQLEKEGRYLEEHANQVDMNAVRQANPCPVVIWNDYNIL